MAKKKIAVMTSGWSIDYILSSFEGMKSVCTKNNLDLYIFTCYKFTETTGESNTTGFAIFDLINFEDYAGIVIMPNLFNDADEVEKQRKRIIEAGIPAVSLNQPLEGLHHINSDNHLPYKNLVSHLIKEHGIKRFAYIGGPDDNAGCNSNFEAYKEALIEGGIKVEDQLYVGNCDWTYASGYEVAKNIFKNKDYVPEAIVCINDWAAMAAIELAEENGYNVPDDIKIIGFDNVDYSDKVIPSITTLNLQSYKMGAEAIELLLQQPEKLTTRLVEAIPHFRQSCGCERKITSLQKKFSQNTSIIIDREQRFASQLRHLEDTFINPVTVKTLSENLQKYFEKRHSFEGPDFSILINQNVITSLKETLLSPKQNTTFDDSLIALVNIEGGQSSIRDSVEAKDLIPENMKSKEPATYLFLPIFTQCYLHGYYVSKDCLDLLKNKSGYNWTRNFGAMIEKFRQTSIYRMLSEQMKFLSTQDALSGLFNRAGLDKYGVTLFEKNNHHQLDTHIIFIDINNMKTINDKFGHLQGDLAVKTVAEAISVCLPSGYLAVRYGGDEFVIIGSYKENLDLCEKIKVFLDGRAEKMTLPYKLTVSFGEKIFAPNETSSLSMAIKEVDEIMYEQKLKFHKEENKS